MPSRQSGRVLAPVFVLAVVVGLSAFLALAAFREGPAPEILVEPAGGSIGRQRTVSITITEPVRGLSRVRAELVQGDHVEELASEEHDPRSPWEFWGPATERQELKLEMGRDAIRGLREGPATLRVTAERVPAWLRRPEPVVEEFIYQVRLTPPSLGVMSTFHFARQGGAEAVVYRVGETSVRDGVQAGDRWFPGFPLPGGGSDDRFALFAVPYDMGDPSSVRLLAADDAGNEAQAAFIDRFTARKPSDDTINLSDAFLNKVVPAIMSRTPEMADSGGLIENFVWINRDLRKANAAELADLASKSAPRFLWSRPFLPMPNAKVTSPFADERTYVYEGRTVDHQVHLGFDLAATKAVPVPSANDGMVVLARYFGIYGNAVVVDHGYGLQSLYGHLSSIDVKEGQQVARGEILGRTGDTGLAGGDHLHFSILLGGQQVNPQEWWDGHWIRDRVARKLGGALPFEE